MIHDSKIETYKGGGGGFVAYDDGGFDNNDDHDLKVSDDDHFQSS